jgi:hypothetical protein
LRERGHFRAALDNFFNALYELTSWQNDFVTAFQATDTNIRAQTDDPPLKTAARMRLAHLHYIAQAYVCGIDQGFVSALQPPLMTKTKLPQLTWICKIGSICRNGLIHWSDFQRAAPLLPQP